MSAKTWIVVAFLACVISCGSGCGVVGDFADAVKTGNWYQLRPTAYVMEDLRTGSGKPPPESMNVVWQWPPSLAEIALSELWRRDKDGRLPRGDRNEIAELALAIKSNPKRESLEPMLIGYLSERAFARDLTAEQTARFFKPAFDMKLTIRPIALEGDIIPLQLVMRNPWVVSGWEATFTYERVEVDRQVVSMAPEPRSYPNRAHVDNPDNRTIQSLPIGPHVITVVIKENVFHGPSFNTEQDGVQRSERLELSAPFQVVARTPENAIRLSGDAAIGPQLLAQMKPDQFKYNIWRPGTISGSVQVRSLPVNVAFDIFAKYDGNEYPVGHFAMAAGAERRGFSCDSESPLPKPPPTIDLVFRPSPQTATTTLDVYEIWNGEIVLSGVPIKDVLDELKEPNSSAHSRKRALPTPD